MAHRKPRPRAPDPYACKLPARQAVQFWLPDYHGTPEPPVARALRGSAREPAGPSRAVGQLDARAPTDGICPKQPQLRAMPVFFLSWRPSPASRWGSPVFWVHSIKRISGAFVAERCQTGIDNRRGPCCSQKRATTRVLERARSFRRISGTWSMPPDGYPALLHASRALSWLGSKFDALTPSRTAANPNRPSAAHLVGNLPYIWSTPVLRRNRHTAAGLSQFALKHRALAPYPHVHG